MGWEFAASCEVFGVRGSKLTAGTWEEVGMTGGGISEEEGSALARFGGRGISTGVGCGAGSVAGTGTSATGSTTDVTGTSGSGTIPDVTGNSRTGTSGTGTASVVTGTSVAGTTSVVAGPSLAGSSSATGICCDNAGTSSTAGTPSTAGVSSIAGICSLTGIWLGAGNWSMSIGKVMGEEGCDSASTSITSGAGTDDGPAPARVA